jgi:sugar lactone lactonase YvrE
LIPEEDWQLVSEGHNFTEGPAVNLEGDVFFTDIPNNRIHKVAGSGEVSVFVENSPKVNGLMFGADGNLYACQNGNQQIVRYDTSGKEEVLIRDAPSNDLVVLPNGYYYTDPEHKKVWYVNGSGERKVVDESIERPNGIITSADQAFLMVADTRGHFIYSFQIQPDGSLAHRQRFGYMHVPNAAADSGADGMTVDTEGRLYVATRMGVQVFDQLGRCNLIIRKPQNKWLSNVAFGGPERDTLFATCGDKVFKRKVRARGVLPGQAPVQPPLPRL